MKLKKMLAVMMVLSMSAAVACAEEINLISSAESDAVVDVIRESTFVKLECKDLKIGEDGVWSATDANGEEVRFILRDNTLTLASDGSVREFAEGDGFAAYIAADEPAPLVLPAIYYPRVIIEMAEDGLNADVDRYTATEEDGLVNDAFNLAISADTKAVDESGKEFDGELDGKDLVVFYGVSTRSIPAQTAPEKVIVLGEEKEISAEDKTENEPTKLVIGKRSFELVEFSGVKMVAVRDVVESLNYEIAWDAETNSVNITSEDRKVSFVIGEKTYLADDDMVIELDGVSTKIETEEGGVTYVPAEFFTKVMAVESVSLI